MAIQTLNGLIGSAKQSIAICKTASRTSTAAAWYGLVDIAGNPGAGTLAGTSTTIGVVPTDATAGYPVINAFGGSNTGYLSRIDFGSSVACRLKLLDCLWKAGAYAFNANTTGQTPASFSSRVPGGTDFNNIQIWFECVTAFTGNPTITITYTNQSGETGRTAVLVVGLAPIVGRRMQIPLQAGDTGVQEITGVVATVATAGTFNILVISPLWSGRCKIANDGDTHGWDKTGGPVVYEDSALEVMVAPDSTATGIIEIEFVIANG